jgi:hypothetical protein
MDLGAGGSRQPRGLLSQGMDPIPACCPCGVGVQRLERGLLSWCGRFAAACARLLIGLE